MINANHIAKPERVKRSWISHFFCLTLKTATFFHFPGWYSEQGHHTPIGDLSKQELANVLKEFYKDAYRKKEAQYSLFNYSTLRKSLSLVLQNDYQMQQVSIESDPEFRDANDMYTHILKMFQEAEQTRNGLGPVDISKKKRFNGQPSDVFYEPWRLTPDKVSKLITSGQLGLYNTKDPKVLVQTVFFYCCYYTGIGKLSVMSRITLYDVHEYLVNGKLAGYRFDLRKYLPPDAPATLFTIPEIPGRPWCPVKTITEYLSHRFNGNPYFFQKPMEPSECLSSDVWFKKCRLKDLNPLSQMCRIAKIYPVLAGQCFSKKRVSYEIRFNLNIVFSKLFPEYCGLDDDIHTSNESPGPGDTVSFSMPVQFLNAMDDSIPVPSEKPVSQGSAASSSPLSPEDIKPRIGMDLSPATPETATSTPVMTPTPTISSNPSPVPAASQGQTVATSHAPTSVNPVTMVPLMSDKPVGRGVSISNSSSCPSQITASSAKQNSHSSSGTPEGGLKASTHSVRPMHQSPRGGATDVSIGCVFSYGNGSRQDESQKNLNASQNVTQNVSPGVSPHVPPNVTMQPQLVTYSQGYPQTIRPNFQANNPLKRQWSQQDQLADQFPKRQRLVDNDYTFLGEISASALIEGRGAVMMLLRLLDDITAGKGKEAIRYILREMKII